MPMKIRMRYFVTHILWWLKPKRQVCVAEGVEKLNPHILLLDYKILQSLGNSFAISENVKLRVVI